MRLIPRTLIAASLLLVSSCARDTPERSAAHTQACDALPGAAEILDAHPHRYLVFGEIHGAREPPRAFGEIVCEASMRGPVIVGIERPPSVTPALQAYIDSDGGAEAEARLMAAFFDGSGWGLSSVAFLDLFRRLRTVRSSGASIGMVGFQQAAAEGSADQTPYERGLAHQLIVAADAAPQARLIVLVGNLHARKAPWLSARSGAFEPMAMHLPGDDVLTFNIANTDGEVFNCAYDDCSVHRVAGSDAGAPPRVELLDDRRVYDGLWAVGAMTASEPIGVRRD